MIANLSYVAICQSHYTKLGYDVIAVDDWQALLYTVQPYLFTITIHISCNEARHAWWKFQTLQGSTELARSKYGFIEGLSWCLVCYNLQLYSYGCDFPCSRRSIRWLLHFSSRVVRACCLVWHLLHVQAVYTRICYTVCTQPLLYIHASVDSVRHIERAQFT